MVENINPADIIYPTITKFYKIVDIPFNYLVI